ncbi:TetR/AcrR family transcriptional regulator [Streptomonospora wellingtoniae]|uniref:Helix-turn-helix domain-containing protein n=1 Tax=Streptomonospora wellingtoniae TaxID=3075544 RepID=A0ABU2L0Y4_9ACTN|nr:helix-turn-helix domain-containing protein [Streptomonospora sp. DSM 45055]MDT0305208.1 helix-turn-helix domain-containing protein [Streptomonospora sp. DSM 45055]
MTESQTRLRADARRNRDRIIAAAGEAFSDQGPDVPMEEIARRAEVGVGTLYRRFPDREALIRAVAQENFRRVLDDARAAAAEEPTAWDALVRVVDRSHRLRVTVQLALVSDRARQILSEDPRTGGIRSELMDELTRIVESAQAEGAMRPDVGAGDVAILFSLVLRQPPVARESAARVFDRARAIMLDGLRAGAAGVLPGDPIRTGELPLR